MPDLEVTVRVTASNRSIDCAFSAVAGKMTVLFGPSGAGKSTVLGAIAGLVEVASGKVVLGEPLFDSEKRVDLPVHLRRIAVVFQSLALFPHMTAHANVAYSNRGAASEWLSKMKVSGLGERMPRTLSGGEAQRVALARAFASEPRALLLDEPFTALDDTLRIELGSEVRKLVSELGIACVLVTHDRDDAIRLGDTAVILQDGRVTKSGSPTALLG